MSLFLDDLIIPYPAPIGESENKSNGGTWVNWKANNSKISRVCNNPYTNALTTNAHVSVAVYVSRQPTCLVYVFRVAVRETYKSCGCFFLQYVWSAKLHFFLHTPKSFAIFLTDSLRIPLFRLYNHSLTKLDDPQIGLWPAACAKTCEPFVSEPHLGLKIHFQSVLLFTKFFV